MFENSRKIAGARHAKPSRERELAQAIAAKADLKRGDQLRAHYDESAPTKQRVNLPGASYVVPDSLETLGRGREIHVFNAGRIFTRGKGEKSAQVDSEALTHSAALISICVIVSRVTGFFRTWFMAFALGASALSSAYQVANNLPSMLYEMVAGGILVTAFLPVYMNVKKQWGMEAGNHYASNLFTIVLLFLTVISAACMIFPQVVVFTQSFWSDQSEMQNAVFFFQFFAIQLLFYGAGAIISGLLNANRNYLWSSIAPAANNLIVILAFVGYAIFAPMDQTLALYIVAIGNPLGVLAQLILQWPALKKSGIRLQLRIDWHDPALKETVRLGLPAMFVMVCSFAVVSVQNAASYNFLDYGPSVLAYARLWFTLPYAFLAVPITTAMFTELSDMQSEGNLQGMKVGILSGTKQIVFFMIPMALYLAVFAEPLITLYLAGKFEADCIVVISTYLAVLAVALPFYGVNTYLQKIYSSLFKMREFATYNFLAAVVQIVLTVIVSLLGATGAVEIWSIAVAEVVFYLVGDVLLFASLRRALGPLGFVSLFKSIGLGLGLGLLGAAVGFGIKYVLTLLGLPIATSLWAALACVIVAGCASVVVTFGLALKLKLPEADFIHHLVGKFVRR